jgi:hypothetical protein
LKHKNILGNFGLLLKEDFMKNKVIALSLASVMSFQSLAFAQSARVDAISTSSVIAADKELMTIRHDIQRLDEALAETALAIQERQENGGIASIVSVSSASLGLALAAVSMTVGGLGADSGVGKLIAMAGFGIVAIKTSSSAALRLVSEVQRGSTNNTEEAHDALIKAQQEIQAARATETLNPKSLETLAQLELSLATIQNSLEDYKDRENLNKGLRLTAMLTQAAGAAVSFYMAAGMMNGYGVSKTGAALGPILMTVGNISAIISVLSPSKAEIVLVEIGKTRAALAQILENL